MKLLEYVREALRVRQYSLHTEETYVRGILIRSRDTRHPQTLDGPEIERMALIRACCQHAGYTGPQYSPKLGQGPSAKPGQKCSSKGGRLDKGVVLGCVLKYELMGRRTCS